MASRQNEVDRCYAAWKGDPTDKNTTALYNALEGIARAILARRCGFVDEAIACELAASVLQAVGNFSGRSKFSTWTNGVLRRLSNNHFRKQKKEKRISVVSLEQITELEDADGVKCDDALYESTDSIDDKILLDQLIAKLSDDDQALVRMKLVGHTNKEVASELRIKEGAVESRWSRIPEKMRMFL